jgi:ABC-type transport system substrate-binding protein
MTKRIDRRSFLARGAATGAGVAVVATSGGVLAACSSGSGSGSGTTSGSSGTGSHPDGVSTATPKSGGSLIFGVDAEEKGFSPTQGTYDEVGIIYARTVFDPLMILSAGGTPQPYLAQSVSPNSDYTVWTITMQPNLVFHNGAPCDAAAVAANFNAQKSSTLTGPALTTVADIAVTSPLVVTVTMKSPWVPFDYYLTGGIGGQFAFIAEPTWLASGSQTDPVGTGPFVFQSWVPNDHFTATKNPHYWRPGLPYLDTITYKPITDPDQMLSSLTSGAIDIMHSDTASDILSQLRARHLSGLHRRPRRTWPANRTWAASCSTCPSPRSTTSSCARPRPTPISSAQYVEVIDHGVNATSNGPVHHHLSVLRGRQRLPRGYNVSKAKSLVQARWPARDRASRCPSPSTTRLIASTTKHR